MEVPQYSVKPNIRRILASKLMILIVLSAVFYALLWFNLRLGFNIDMPLIVNLLVVVVIIIAMIIELIRFHVSYSQYEYLFYTNRVIFKKKDKLINFFYKDYMKSKLSKNPLDAIMKTGSIVLSKKFKIGPINKPHKVYEYFLKLVDYYKKTNVSNLQKERSNQNFHKQTEM